MEKRWGLILMLSLFVSGCIEAGSLNLPNENTKIDLSNLRYQLEEIGKTPSSGEMGVPLRSLPRHFVRSVEHGSYSETFVLSGFPSATIVWRVERDPYGKEYERIKADSNAAMTLIIDETEIPAVITKEKGLYMISTHIGLYTFAAETEFPEEIDSIKVYGTHDEVVKEVFEAGVENSLSFDLDSPGN